MTAAARPGAIAVWPPLAHRRGGSAAALLFVLALDASQWIALVLWSVVPWSSLQRFAGEAALLGCGILLLQLLGPGTLRREFGGRPSATSMRSGFLLGLLGIAMFWGYHLISARFRPTTAAGWPVADLAHSLSVSLTGPIVEEIMFRGVLWCAVRRVSPPWASIAITALVFTIMHGTDRLLDFPCLFAYGILTGMLRHRSNSLSPSMLAHSVTNAGLILFLGL